jgi:type IV pilus biogenesis protein CpaD/CtpE
VTGSRLRAVVLAIAASLLAGCATERSDGSPCPPVVAYGREFLVRVADELDVLPPGSAIEQMLADYQVMRDQARACERFGE